MVGSRNSQQRVADFNRGFIPVFWVRLDFIKPDPAYPEK
jgi:hypothetical protein